MLRVDQLRGGRRVPVGAWGVFADHGTVNKSTFHYYNGDHSAAAHRVFEAARAPRRPRGPAARTWCSSTGTARRATCPPASTAPGRRPPSGSGAARPPRCSPPGARPGAGSAAPSRARLALDARVLLRPADPVRQARRHRRVRALVPDRLGGGPRAALRRHQAARSRAAGSTPRWSRRDRKTPTLTDPGHTLEPTAVPLTAARLGDRVIVSVPGEMTVELARRTRAAAAARDGRLRPAPGGDRRLRQRVRLLPHHPGGVRGAALRGRHDRVRAGQRRVHRLRARRPGRARSRAARPPRSRRRSTPRAACGPTARPIRAARRRDGSSGSRARPGASNARRSPGAAPPTGSTGRSTGPSSRSSATRRAAGAPWTTTAACASSGGSTTTGRRSSASPCSTRAGAAPTGPAWEPPRNAPAGRYRFVVSARRYRLASRTLRPPARPLAPDREAPGPPRPAGAGAPLPGARAGARPHDPARAVRARAPSPLIVGGRRSVRTLGEGGVLLVKPGRRLGAVPAGAARDRFGNVNGKPFRLR